GPSLATPAANARVSMTGSAVPGLLGYRDFGLSLATLAANARVSETESAVPGLRGYRDFGLAITQPQVAASSVSRPAAQPADEISAGGFHWGDAGAGAAATLGFLVIVGGLGAGLVSARRHSRQIGSA